MKLLIRILLSPIWAPFWLLYNVFMLAMNIVFPVLYWLCTDKGWKDACGDSIRRTAT